MSRGGEGSGFETLSGALGFVETVIEGGPAVGYVFETTTIEVAPDK